MIVVDNTVSMTSNDFAEDVAPVSLVVEQTAVEWRAVSQTTNDVTETAASQITSAGNATKNQPSVATQRPAVELPAEDELPPYAAASVGGGCFILQQVEPVTFPPPPPSPLPPLPPLPSLSLSPSPASVLFSRPPRYTNTSTAGVASIQAGCSISSGAGSHCAENSGSSEGNNEGNTANINAGNTASVSAGNSGIVSAGDNGFIGAGNNHVAANKSNNAKQIQSVILSQTPVQLTGTTERMDFPVESQRTPSPPSQRPPPPPPPLPLGSYHSIRYAKDLRKL